MILKIHPKLVETIVSHAADASAPPSLEEAARRKPATEEKPKTEAVEPAAAE